MEDKYCINKYTYEISIACQKDSTFISKELFNRMDYFWKSTSNESINEKNKAIYLEYLKMQKNYQPKLITNKTSEIKKDNKIPANMSQEEKIAYTCNKVYGFWTWSGSYKECIYKLTNADNDKQRVIEQQRIQAYQENQRLIEQQKIQAYQEEQNKIAQEQIDRADNLRRAQILFDFSRSLNPPPRPQTNCQTTYMGAIAQTRCY